MRASGLIFFLFPLIMHSQDDLPYKEGERFEFDISYGGIMVGSAEMEILSQETLNKTPVFHIVAKGKTARFFDLFFKVRDVYETYLDTQHIRPVKFIRDIREGEYKKKQLYNFNHLEGLVFSKNTSYSISSKTQDMLSAFFYARTFNKKNLTQTKAFFIPIFMDEEIYSLEILHLYNEKIKTKFGNIECMVFKPKMQQGRVFEDGEQMKIWISNDKNRLLVKVETKILVGTIKAFLVDYKKLKYPLSISK